MTDNSVPIQSITQMAMFENSPNVPKHLIVENKDAHIKVEKADSDSDDLEWKDPLADLDFNMDDDGDTYGATGMGYGALCAQIGGELAMEEEMLDEDDLMP